jgi:hypothetical protein
MGMTLHLGYWKTSVSYTKLTILSIKPLLGTPGRQDQIVCTARMKGKASDMSAGRCSRHVVPIERGRRGESCGWR